MRIELDIDELIVNGIPVQDPEGLKAVVSAELARLLGEAGHPPALASGGAIPLLEGGPITVGPDNPAASLGSQIAQAVYGGLAGE